ncbi:MAG: GntR family transcriptional regulator [Oscillospiraceae bacterium]|nr:GntR family transcriptional regulator [Oscillospiraceae bacterium]
MKERFIGIELRSLNNAVRRYLEQSAAELTEDRITCSNAWIIGHLAKAQADVYQRDIEEEFGVTRSTVSKVLILLEKKGIIIREGVASDARLKKLQLTDKGRAIARSLEENAFRMEARLISGFSEEELSQLSEYLKRLKDNIEPTDKEENI